MDQEMLMNTANNVYGTIRQMLDSKNLKYKAEDDKLKIYVAVQGDDFPVESYITVLPDKQVVILTSPMPFRVPEEKRSEAAVALTLINYRLLNGHFCLDLSDGFVELRLTEAYHESLIGADVFDYLVQILWVIADEYNDKLFALVKGMVTLEQFAQSIS